jgi:hypothetical protein
LDVLFTLAARFQGNAGWKEEFFLLSKVTAAVLNNSFHKLKYEGEGPEDQTRAAAQLAMLKAEPSKAGWKANYQRLGIFSSKGQASSTSEGELLARSKAQLCQLKNHLREFGMIKAAEQDNREKLNDLKQKIQAAPKYSTIKGLDPSIVISACLELLGEAEETRPYQAILFLLSGSADSLRFNEQIQEDLRSLAELLKYREAGREAIVFSTTTDDPKLLLMTGALVDASSCQDFRFGSRVDTLLGYAVDADIKLVLSYSLREGNFASVKEYQEAKRLIQQGTQPVFIPAKQWLRIGSIEIALPKASKRRIIKLGETDSGTAGIRDEIEYAQNHFAESLMEAQIKEVLAELAEKSQAKQGEKITIPPSRNPLGIYSDLAGGAKTEAYSID